MKINFFQKKFKKRLTNDFCFDIIIKQSGTETIKTVNNKLRVCWNRQTGTFEGRVSMTYEFKSRHSHQSTPSSKSSVFLFYMIYFMLFLILEIRFCKSHFLFILQLFVAITVMLLDFKSALAVFVSISGVNFLL